MDSPSGHPNCPFYITPLVSPEQLIESCTLKLLKAVWVTSEEGTNGPWVIQLTLLLAALGNEGCGDTISWGSPECCGHFWETESLT